MYVSIRHGRGRKTSQISHVCQPLQYDPLNHRDGVQWSNQRLTNTPGNVIILHRKLDLLISTLTPYPNHK